MNNMLKDLDEMIKTYCDLPPKAIIPFVVDICNGYKRHQLTFIEVRKLFQNYFNLLSLFQKKEIVIELLDCVNTVFRRTQTNLLLVDNVFINLYEVHNNGSRSL